jgi:hypothetical protein
MRGGSEIWAARASELKSARRAFAAGEPRAVRKLHDALQRIAVTASSLGRRRLERAARRLARRLRKRRRLETHRQLLARVRDLKFLSPEAAAGLDSGWERLAAKCDREAMRASGRPLRRIAKRLVDGGGRRRPNGFAPRLADALERAREAVVSPPTASASGSELTRYRRAVRACVHLSADLDDLGHSGDARAPRERSALVALDRWHDLRRFRQRLQKSRGKAESQGAVTLVSELDAFLAVLAHTEQEEKRRALEAARPLSNVVPLSERAAAGE